MVIAAAAVVAAAVVVVDRIALNKEHCRASLVPRIAVDRQLDCVVYAVVREPTTNRVFDADDAGAVGAGVVHDVDQSRYELSMYEYSSWFWSRFRWST